MSISVFIAAETPEEFEALNSEGAPEANMSSATFMKVCNLYGLGTQPNWGTCEAWKWIAGHFRATTTAQGELETLRVAEVMEVARAAEALGRKVAWG